MSILEITKRDVVLSSPRFWRRVLSGDPGLCWPWLLKPDKDGYGLFSLRGNRVMAHRVAWAIHNAKPLPAGKVVMHSCDNPRCCNPAHLVLGSQVQNLADRDAKGRTPLGRSPMAPQPAPAEVAPPPALPTIRLERDPKPITPESRAPRSARRTSEIMADLMLRKAAKRTAKKDAK